MKSDIKRSLLKLVYTSVFGFSLSLEAIPAVHLHAVLSTVQEYEVIGIDEGQFVRFVALICSKHNWLEIHSVLQFPDTVEIAEMLANRGKIVIVAALDGTFQREVTEIDKCYWFVLLCHTSLYPL